ncbi:DNA pilot protein [robinz microvirus RP_30]|nr:DNA pilot protein [robinz microvirus RP_29]UDN67484.1 DNA pilot protein [robinz microvirus RP_30]
MWPVIGGLLSGGASLLSGMFSSQTAKENTGQQLQAQQAMQKESEDFNAGQAGINRDFQADQAAVQRSYETQMSNTAYQRSKADMAAAGLNPILAAGAGGASTPSVSAPSGSSASVGTPNAPMSQRQSPLAGLGDAVNKTVNTAISMKTYDKMTEEIANLRADEALTSARTGTQYQLTGKAREEAERAVSEKRIAALQVPGAEFSAKQASDLNRMPTWLRSAAVQGGYLGGKASDIVAPLVSSAGAVRRFMPTTTEGSRQNAGGGSFDEFYRHRVGG